MRISTLIAAMAGPITGALALLATPCALALSLGDAAPQSTLGQPLRVAVAIEASKAQALTAACVHVMADASGGNGPPRLLTGRVTIDRTAAGAQLLVTTARAVNEPVVRRAVQAGCDGTTRRDYVLLLDPPGAGAASAVVAQRGADAAPVAAAAVPPAAKPAPSGVVRVATAAPAPARRAPAPAIVAIEPVPQRTTMLSSPGGSSFIPEAAAAGLRSSSSQNGLPTADAESPVAPWWPLAAALLVVGALARWLVPMRRRSMEPPAWVAPTARTEPNPSVSGATTSKTFGKTGHFAAMTEPGPGFPRGASKTGRTAAQADTTTTKPQAGEVKAAISSEDRRFADFDADLLEEQTIRAEWAKAVSDGAIDIGSDSILKAIDDAERETQGAPAHPAQVALDRSLDDELLPKKSGR